MTLAKPRSTQLNNRALFSKNNPQYVRSVKTKIAPCALIRINIAYSLMSSTTFESLRRFPVDLPRETDSNLAKAEVE